jgi:hypothetical protein
MLLADESHPPFTVMSELLVKVERIFEISPSCVEKFIGRHEKAVEVTGMAVTLREELKRAVLRPLQLLMELPGHEHKLRKIAAHSKTGSGPL